MGAAVEMQWDSPSFASSLLLPISCGCMAEVALQGGGREYRCFLNWLLLPPVLALSVARARGIMRATTTEAGCCTVG